MLVTILKKVDADILNQSPTTSLCTAGHLCIAGQSPWKISKYLLVGVFSLFVMYSSFIFWRLSALSFLNLAHTCTYRFNFNNPLQKIKSPLSCLEFYLVKCSFHIGLCLLSFFLSISTRSGKWSTM